jgi:hypothetical protein
LFDDIALNKGMLTENLVAQMLAAAGRKLYFFSRSDSKDRANRMEIDFLIAKSKLARKNNIHALEVKNGTNTTHRSLNKFTAKEHEGTDPCGIARQVGCCMKSAVFFDVTTEPRQGGAGVII